MVDGFDVRIEADFEDINDDRYKVCIGGKDNNQIMLEIPLLKSADFIITKHISNQ